MIGRSGYSKRAIARMLGILRNAIRNHIESRVSKITKAAEPEGKAAISGDNSLLPSLIHLCGVCSKLAKRYAAPEGTLIIHVGKIDAI